VGLAMLAAEFSMGKQKGSPLNSLHFYFLRPGSSSEETNFVVEILREGQSFSVCSVSVLQKKEVILSGHCSFHAPEKQDSRMGHSVCMPENILPPEDLPSLSPVNFPLEVRQAKPSCRGVPTWPPVAYLWIKSPPLPPPSPTSAHLHRASVAFASDWGLGVVSLLPYNLTWSSPQLKLAASLDHSLWFHDSFSGLRSDTGATAKIVERHPDATQTTPPSTSPRADDWLLYEFKSDIYSGCRGFNHGRIWTRDGSLVASCAQESLLRPKLLEQEK